MDTAQRAHELASAFAEGIDAIVRVRERRGAPHLAHEVDPRAVGKALSHMKTALETMVASAEAGEGWTSLRVNDELMQRIEAVLAYLPTIAPGAPLPDAFFDRVDLAWTEIERAMG